MSPQRKFAGARATRRWLVAVCILLLAVSAVAQSHLHPDDSITSPKHCPICQVAHSISIQVAVVSQLHVMFTTTGYLDFAQDHDQLLDLYAAWHFSRPPPHA
jgi:Protein of unknown function (DUF1275)